MRAVVVSEGGLAVEEVPVSRVGEREVLVEVMAAGICGTDLAIIAGTLPTPKPLVIGHEFSGVVREAGALVDPSWVGKRVTSEINEGTCGKCYFCVRGIPSQCPSRRALGIDVDGAFAEYVVVEEKLLHELPDGTSFEEGTFVEPLAAAIQTFELCPLTPEDENVVIFGPGKLGLLVLQVAAARAPKARLFVVGRGDGKLRVASTLGAHEVVNSNKVDAVGYLLAATNGVGADVVVDTTGNADAIGDVVRACRSRGRVYMKSTHGVPTPVNTTELVVREINLFTSRCGPFPEAIRMMEANEVRLSPLITKTFPLDRIREALDYIRDSNPLKVVLSPPSGRDRE
ncbi:MAG: alcohol dehydrogenase catalytic domain-containing protein [Promethearchaeota archaeon]